MAVNVLKSEDSMTVSEILTSMGEMTPGDLIPILQKVQDQYGYLPQDVLKDVSKHTSIPISRIYGVATFYEQFYLEPRGKHIIKCCRGTACYVRGGLTLIDSIKNELGVEEGETTGDFQFTFETVACLGTCALAPVMMVDDTYYGKMDSKKVKKLIAELRSAVKETAS
jgi:NADH-quinone oxidoreductase subunit E